MGYVPSAYDGGQPKSDGIIRSSRGKCRALTKKQEQAVMMVMETNLPLTQIARQTGMTRQNLRRILDREQVATMQRKATERALRGAAVRAAQVLVKQLDDPNPWVAQNAARTIIQYSQSLDKVVDSGITVNFVTMPQPAMPTPEVDEPPVAVYEQGVT